MLGLAWLVRCIVASQTGTQEPEIEVYEVPFPDEGIPENCRAGGESSKCLPSVFSPDLDVMHCSSLGDQGGCVAMINPY
jgi:hypothetical protein